MAQHFCPIHKVPFFKKGKMKGYAHPILDENGEPTFDDEGRQGWCNEPDEAPKPATPEKISPTRIDNSASIELQVAYKGIIELAVSDRLKMDSQAVRTALNWAMSKLGNWASSIVEDKPPMPEETREKVGEALGKIDPLNWQVVRPQVERLMSSKKKGWETTSLILTKLKGLGANPESKMWQVAYESLNDRGKQQFVDLVKTETPSRLIEEAVKLGAEEV